MLKLLKTGLVAVIAIIAAMWLAGCGTANSFVVDKAGVLDKVQSENLDRKVTDYEKKNGVQIAVAVLDSLKGESIDDCSSRMFKEMGLGQKGINNGALVLCATKEKKLRITVGYGLEWQISDAVADGIIEEMVPSAREDKIYEAVSLAVDRIIGLTENLAWTIRYEGLQPARKDGEKSSGGIISLGGFQIENRDGTLITGKSGGEAVQLNITEHMGGLADEIAAKNGKCKVIARIRSIDPCTADLLGVVD